MSEATIMLKVPESLEAYGERLDKFFEAMLEKLDRNSHKRTPTSAHMPVIVGLLRREVMEFEEQVREDPHHPNAVMELADIANFAFLASVALSAGPAPSLPPHVAQHLPSGAEGTPQYGKYYYMRHSEARGFMVLGPLMDTPEEAIQKGEVLWNYHHH